jgi:ankyrin repeat protein
MAKVKGDLRTNLNPKSYPSICQAVISGQHRIVKRLLAAGEDPDRRTVTYLDYTPLMWAISYDRYGIAKQLLDAGADIDAQDADGKTALHQAIVKGDLKAVQFLINHGSDIEIGWAREIYEIPMSPAKHSILRGDADIFRALVKAGAHLLTSA